MKMNFKLLIPAVALAALCSLSFGQIQSMGQGKSVKGIDLDTKKFLPQINTAKRLRHAETEHELKLNLPQGLPNNLPLGGLLDSTRVTTGAGALFAGQDENGAEPPDPDIAVGPNHIIGVVNSSIAFFTKTGTKTFEQSIESFFSGLNPDSIVSDPKAIYDPVANRFVVEDLSINIASSGGVSFIMVAVSATSDPNGQWKLFKVDVSQTSGGNNYWMDYPGFGYNKDMIAFAGNMFAQSGSSGYNGVQIVVLDKAALYGGTATPTKFSMPADNTTQIVKTLDNNPILYAVSVASHTSMMITGITKAGSTISAQQTSQPIPRFENDSGSITGPGGVVVQTNDTRLLIGSSLKGRFVTSHNVGVSASDDSTCARWYEFKTNGWPVSAQVPVLAQSGQVNPPAGHGYSFPAINYDAKGNIGMTFSLIGTSTPGKVMVTGRKVTDPAGAMGIPVVAANSQSGTYNGFSTRWGDFFDVELDPVDSKTFWAVGMGAGPQGRWRTYISSFKIALADVDLTPVTPSGITVVAGTLVSGSKASLATVDNANLVIQSQAVSGLGQVAGFNAVYQMPFAGAVDTLHINIAVAGSTGSSALISLLNKNTGRYEQISTMGLTTTMNPKSIELTAAQIALYVNSSNQVSMIVRAVSPSRSGTSPVPFQFSTDQAILRVAPVS